MADIKFEKDQVLLLKPTSIKNTNKVVKSQHFGGDCIRYDLEFEDKNKATGKAEFLCRAGNCEDFQLGIFRYVKVSWLAGRGDATVEPCEPPGESSKPNLHKRDREEAVIDTQTTPAPNPFNVSVNGRAATYAMAYAKDIKAAQIATRGASAEVTDADIEDVIRWSGKIAIGITENMDF